MGSGRTVRTWGAAPLFRVTTVTLATRSASWAGAAQDDNALAVATPAAETAELAALPTEEADLQTQVTELTTPTTIVVLSPATGTVTPVDCGQPITTFGGGAASVDGMRPDALETRTAAPVTPSPAAGVEAFAIELVIGNETDAPLRLAPTDFCLTGGDGVLYAPIEAGPVPRVFAIDVAAAETHRDRIAFALPDGALPARFVHHSPQRGRLDHPLTTERGGAASGSAVGAGATGCDGNGAGDSGNAIDGNAIGGAASEACAGR